ncbi:MAG: DNA polymerase III subunit delta [Patescibacteria group bacterium]|jgi:DNA polymerase III delta subunit
MDFLILHGEDTFRSRKRLMALREGFKKKYDPKGTNITAYSAPFDLGQIRNSLAQVGMFAKKRLVVLYDFYSTTTSADREKFNEWLSKDAFPDSVIICWEGKDLGQPSVVKKTKTPSKSKKPKTVTSKITWPEHAKVEIFEPLAQAQLLAWIRQEVKRFGGAIAPAAVNQLENNIGPDLWTLNNVIAQLIAAANNKPIDLPMVNEWTKSPLDENIFHFTDAISSRNLSEALTLFQSQLNLGIHPLVLHSMLIRQVRALVMVEECLRQNMAFGSIAQATNLHPYVAQKAAGAVKKFQTGELQRLFIRLADLDVEMKTGKIEPEIALADFIANACLPSSAKD